LKFVVTKNVVTKRWQLKTWWLKVGHRSYGDQNVRQSKFVAVGFLWQPNSYAKLWGDQNFIEFKEQLFSHYDDGQLDLHKITTYK
jgi:hypothetical protein